MCRPTIPIAIVKTPYIKHSNLIRRTLYDPYAVAAASWIRSPALMFTQQPQAFSLCTWRHELEDPKLRGHHGKDGKDIQTFYVLCTHTHVHVCIQTYLCIYIHTYMIYTYVYTHIYRDRERHNYLPTSFFEVFFRYRALYSFVGIWDRSYYSGLYSHSSAARFPTWRSRVLIPGFLVYL